MTWTFAGAQPITQSVVRSQAGKIARESTAPTEPNDTTRYSYGPTGPLTSAKSLHHVWEYSFTPTPCGSGANGNRTAMRYVKDGIRQIDTNYCYDTADRLTSTAVSYANAQTNVPASADELAPLNPVNDGLMPSEIVYDTHGNTVILGDRVLRYDVQNRHISTAVADGPVISYVRDATGRIVQRSQLRRWAFLTYSVTPSQTKGMSIGESWTGRALSLNAQSIFHRERKYP
jgi:hypothetical protein